MKSDGIEEWPLIVPCWSVVLATVSGEAGGAGGSSGSVPGAFDRGKRREGTLNEKFRILLS